MNLKRYFLSVVLAAAGAAVFTFLFWIASILSWLIVYLIFIIAFIPVANAACKFYVDRNCLDFEDFWDALMELLEEKKPPKDNNRII